MDKYDWELIKDTVKFLLGAAILLGLPLWTMSVGEDYGRAAAKCEASGGVLIRGQCAAKVADHV